MQKQLNFKHVALLLALWIPAIWCVARSTILTDGYSQIHIQEGNLHGTPKGSTIQAFIDGHTLTVVFTENIGQVAVAVTTSEGTRVYYTMEQTPNGVICYIPATGDFVVTFTMENGDEYYGEFTITE